MDLALTIAAANLDLDATVTAVELVGGTPVVRKVRTVVTWGGLPIDYLQHHKPDTFGSPCTTMPSCSPWWRAWDSVRRCTSP